MLRIPALVLLVAAAACGGSASPVLPSPTPQATRTTTPTPTSTPAPTASAPASVVPSDVPSGTPAGYAKDVGASNLPPSALVPAGVGVTDAWSTTTSAGETAGVAYVAAGDPLQVPHGLVIWRRSPGVVPPWKPVFGLTTDTGSGVFQIETLLGEATGDGSDDALVFEATGGSGACGITLLLDLAANAQVFRKTACDTVVSFSPSPVGLSIRQAVFGPSDSHCCPSAFRTTVLTYTGTTWVVASRTSSPA